MKPRETAPGQLDKEGRRAPWWWGGHQCPDMKLFSTQILSGLKIQI